MKYRWKLTFHNGVIAYFETEAPVPTEKDLCCFNMQYCITMEKISERTIFIDEN